MTARAVAEVGITEGSQNRGHNYGWIGTQECIRRRGLGRTNEGAGEEGEADGERRRDAVPRLADRGCVHNRNQRERHAHLPQHRRNLSRASQMPMSMRRNARQVSRPAKQQRHVGSALVVTGGMRRADMQRASQPNSWPLLTAGSCVGVKQPGPVSPWPTRTPGMIATC